MPRTLSIRHVPTTLHRRLKRRAARAGLSLSEYLLNELRRAAERPTLDELRVRLARLPLVEVDVSPAAVIRAHRDGR